MKILVVEDEKQILKFIQKGLQAEGFVVDSAASGERGLFLGLTGDYDLAILDIRLPERNGIDICKEFRKKGKMMPVLILTVVGDTESKVEALDAGADDYLTKPFSFEELLARVRALLRREKKTVGNILATDDLVLNLTSHTVTREGKPIELTKKEFVLLEYFMRNIDAVLTRNMILEHVWDMNTDPFTNTVDVHVRSLRRKIGDTQKKRLIHTVHGYGYRMEAPKIH